MLKAHGEEFLLPLPNFRVYPMSLGMLLALLLFFSNNPLAYSALFLVLKFVEQFGSARDVNPRLIAGLADARSRAAQDDPRRDAWFTIEHYYFAHRHLLLWFTVTATCGVAFAVSVVDWVTPFGPLASGAYALLIIALAANEIVYTIWRRQRDRALGDSF